MVVKEVAYAWKNGEVVSRHEVMAHLASPSLPYEFGVIEDIRCYRNEKTGCSFVYRLHDHVTRFLTNCEADSMEVPYTVGELCEAVVRLICANKLPDCCIRVMAYHKPALAGVCAEGLSANVVIACWPFIPSLENETLEGNGTISVSTRHQLSDEAVQASAETTEVHASIALPKLYSVECNQNPVILLTEKGAICKSLEGCLFTVRGGSLCASPLPKGILGGVTRDAILRIAKKEGIPLRARRRLTRSNLYIADEVFMVTPAGEIVFIGSIDDCVIGGGEPGEISQVIRDQFIKTVHGEKATYKKWGLTEISL